MSLFAQLLANGVASGAAYVLLALGFAVIYNATREFHIAHAGAFTAAGYAGHVVHARLGMPGALVVAALAAALYGWVVNAAVYGPLRRLRASGLQIFVASLGFVTIFSAVIEIGFGTENLAWSGTARVLTLSGVRLPAPFAVLVVITASALVAVHLFMTRTVRGFELRAVSSNLDLSRGTGIHVAGTIAFSYVLGSALVAPAAVIIGMDAGTNPYRGLQLALIGIVATLMGGIGSYNGAALTALAMALVESVGLLVSSSEWTRTILYTLFIAVLMLRPYGLLGSAARGKGGRA